jgi:protein-tyrosine phosphatase
MSHIDLHLHLLPGVDDGPPDEAASLVHAARLAREGVHEATVTPHVGHPDYPLDVATIAERTRALQAAIEAEGIELLLHPGGEIHPLGATALAPGDLDLIAHGPRGARWVLFEVPFTGIDAGVAGGLPAHPRIGLRPPHRAPRARHGLPHRRPRAAPARARRGRPAWESSRRRRVAAALNRR